MHAINTATLMPSNTMLHTYGQADFKVAMLMSVAQWSDERHGIRIRIFSQATKNGHTVQLGR